MIKKIGWLLGLVGGAFVGFILISEFHTNQVANLSSPPSEPAGATGSAATSTVAPAAPQPVAERVSASTQMRPVSPAPNGLGDLPPENAISVDKLLDDADKTEVARAKIEAHNRLLVSEQYLRNAVYPRTGGDEPVPTREDLRHWASALYNDALFARQIVLGKAVAEKFPNEEFSKERSALLLENDDAGLPRGYLNALQPLLVEVFRPDPMSDGQARSLQHRLLDLVEKRKHYSDNFFKSRMKDYFGENGYTLEQELAYHGQFIDARDLSLTRYGADYFREMLDERPLSPGERKKILAHIARARGIFQQ